MQCMLQSQCEFERWRSKQATEQCSKWRGPVRSGRRVPSLHGHTRMDGIVRTPYSMHVRASWPEREREKGKPQCSACMARPAALQQQLAGAARTRTRAILASTSAGRGRHCACTHVRVVSSRAGREQAAGRGPCIALALACASWHARPAGHGHRSGHAWIPRKSRDAQVRRRLAGFFSLFVSVCMAEQSRRGQPRKLASWALRARYAALLVLLALQLQ